MALYEITFLTKEETDPGVKNILEQGSGSIVEESSLGRRKLAYPINKETQAVYTTFVFDAPATALPEINRRLRLLPGLMRYLLVAKAIARVNKEVSKTVREAIAAAEKLDDLIETTADLASFDLVADDSSTDNQLVEVADTTTDLVATEPVTTELVVDDKPAAKKAKPTKTAKSTEPVKKASSKREPADAAEATEEDRLKALEDKLSDILKD